VTQEALLKLGFYSGEEDMEYSTFSSGTERAVKTWQVSNTVLLKIILHAILHLCYPLLMIWTLFQATVGTSENGVMTSELLERLFSGKTGEDAKMKVSLGQCDSIY